MNGTRLGIERVLGERNCFGNVVAARYVTGQGFAIPLQIHGDPVPSPALGPQSPVHVPDNGSGA